MWPKRPLDFDEWVASLADESGCFWKLAANFGLVPRACRLRPESICIDAGIALKQVDHDAAGTRRPQGKGIDLGAVEFLPPAGGER